MRGGTHRANPWGRDISVPKGAAIIREEPSHQTVIVLCAVFSGGIKPLLVCRGKGFGNNGARQNMYNGAAIFVLLVFVLAEIHKAIEQFIKFDFLVFLAHVPAAIRTIAACLHLNGAEPGSFYVSDKNIDVWDAFRREGGNVTAPKQFRHDMMCTSRTEQSGLRGYSHLPYCGYSNKSTLKRHGNSNHITRTLELAQSKRGVDRKVVRE